MHPPPCLSSWKSYKYLNKTVPWNNGQTTDRFTLVASYEVWTSLQNLLWHPPLIHTHYETLSFSKELIKWQENKAELTTPIEKTSLLTDGRPPDCTSAGWYARVPYNFVVVCSRVMCVWRLVLLSALCAVACWACPRSLILASMCLSSKMLALSDRNVMLTILHSTRRARLPGVNYFIWQGEFVYHSQFFTQERKKSCCLVQPPSKDFFFFKSLGHTFCGQRGHTPSLWLPPWHQSIILHFCKKDPQCQEFTSFITQSYATHQKVELFIMWDFKKMTNLFTWIPTGTSAKPNSPSHVEFSSLGNTEPHFVYTYIYIHNWLKFMLCPWLCIVNIITRPFLKTL